MTVLSDREIQEELKNGDLDVTPVNLEEQLQPNSLDIRLGSDVSSIQGHKVIDSKKSIEESAFKMNVSENGWFQVSPEDFLLVNTVEDFNIPDYLYAELNGRSSIARLGIEIHSTGGVIDSGFEGDLVLEISNNLRQPVQLYPGMRIAQIIFYRLGESAKTPYSEENNKYQGQEGAVHSRISEEL